MVQRVTSLPVEMCYLYCITILNYCSLNLKNNYIDDWDDLIRILFVNLFNNGHFGTPLVLSLLEKVSMVFIIVDLELFTSLGSPERSLYKLKPKTDDPIL